MIDRKVVAIGLADKLGWSFDCLNDRGKQEFLDAARAAIASVLEQMEADLKALGDEAATNSVKWAAQRYRSADARDWELRYAGEASGINTVRSVLARTKEEMPK